VENSGVGHVQSLLGVARRTDEFQSWHLNELSFREPREGLAISQRVKPVSPIRRQAADALRRARRLPIGHDRNDLRQLALGLLWLEKRGYLAIPEDLVLPERVGANASKAIGETAGKNNSW